VPPTVFVSYSHQDKVWKDLLLPQLRVLAQLALIDVWVDERIDAGATWYPEIQAAMEKAAAAVCLISANYLSSDFVLKEEVPYFLAQREKKGLLLLPVLVSECPWRLVEWIKATQLVPRGALPLDSLPDPDKNKVLSGLAELIAAKLGKKEQPPERAKPRMRGSRREQLFEVGDRRSASPEAAHEVADRAAREALDEAAELSSGLAPTSPAGLFRSPAPDTESDEEPRSVGTFGPPHPPPPSLPALPAPDAVDIARLPVTGSELFGRAEELRWLDHMWDSREVRVVSLVGWGGVGKSTLVNKWLERMAAEGYRGARKVFGWSFFSQGTSERVTSADLFIDQALRFFGDPDPTAGSPWSKGERLAALVRQDRSLLLLDGLEPLQSPSDGWRVQDPGLAQLLRRLARPPRAEAGAPQDTGLCVITTRAPVSDLDGFPGTVEACNLEQISAEAGRALLRVRGVRGTDAELEGVARAFGNQALALNLLASFLQAVPGHPASAAVEVPDLAVSDERGRHPRRLLEAFARRFGAGPEIELLLLLGLFDRPAPAGALAALRAAPPIHGLTDHLAVLSEVSWAKLLRKLRAEKLIAEEDRHQPEEVDAHPLVREHFGERLEESNPVAWEEGNRRLFDFYSVSAEYQPHDLAGMAPLFLAVHHACEAGLYDEALEVYWGRILRERNFFAGSVLGLYGALLQALAGFFEIRWTQPLMQFDTVLCGGLLSQAGGFLTPIGRLREAVEAHEHALALSKEYGDELGAAIEKQSLSYLFLSLGELPRALAEAERSIDLARRAGSEEYANSGTLALATILHNVGRFEQAEAQFLKVTQKDIHSGQPLSPNLLSFFRFDMLLDLGNWREVLRGERYIVAATSSAEPRMVACGHLIRGRAHLLAASDSGNRHLASAAEHLEKALDGFRHMGWQGDLSSGLLARADLRRRQSEFRGALDDLGESLEISTRCEFRLLEADTYLAHTRLHLAQHNPTAARASLTRARAIITSTGYHRRDRDLADLEAELGRTRLGDDLSGPGC
jgi:tetratricopeptide (TPR) repeat protein